MHSIVEAEGAVVPELGNRNGKRKMSCDRLSRGGKRVKGESHKDLHWFHNDAVSAKAELLDKAIIKYELSSSCHS